MEHQEYLAIISEIAAAFAGFTGIVAAFRVRDRQWQQFELLRFITMLRASFSALFLSLSPYLLFVLLENEASAWRWAAALVATVMILNLSWFLLRGGPANLGRSQTIMFPFGVAIAFGNCLAVVNLLPPDKAVLVAVTWQLGVSVFNFLSLIIAASPQQEPAAELTAGTRLQQNAGD